MRRHRLRCLRRGHLAADPDGARARARAGGPCPRCIVTTTDQQTAERGVEPLCTLAQFPRDADEPTDVNFGQNFIHETRTGILAVGAPIEVLPV